MSKKIALAITLISIMFASTFVGLPVVALDWYGSANDERQMVIPGTLFDELFPEYNHTYWQKNSLTVGFTEYGETVTDQDPLGEGSDYGVGLTYPSVPADPYDPDATNVYVVEHIACPTVSGGPSPGGLIYIPIEGWQLFWKWSEDSVGHQIDPSWHVSMAIYGNHSAPYGTRARLDVKLASELGYEAQGMKIITNTSRLFAVKTHFYTYNETLLTDLALDPVVFEIELIYVFFKNTKKLVQFWTIQYLRSEYGAVDVVFRRLTDWSVDNKFQDFQNENFACFFPTQKNMSTPTAEGMHALATGCDYWPQNYSLGLAWTNRTIEHWDPDDAQHHVAFIAYYPNCSNWDTDNWNWYLTNMWTQWRKNAPLTYIWLDPDRDSVEDAAYLASPNPLKRSVETNSLGPLTVRYSGQPTTNEYFEYTDAQTGEIRFAASPLMMGQWNFTLTSATANRMAKFVNVMGVTNCSDTFGYNFNPLVRDIRGIVWGGSPGNHYSGDWDSEDDLGGGRTLSEIKYLLMEVFESFYKINDNEGWNADWDLDDYYPFSGMEWGTQLIYEFNNTWLPWADLEESGRNPRNCTFIFGDSDAHNGMVFTSEGSHVVDVVGGAEVAMDFGEEVDNDGDDPWWEAMWDTIDFMGGAIGPFVPEVGAPDFFWELTMETYLDPLPDYSPVGPISTDLTLTALRRMSARRAWCWGADPYINYFTTPTGCGWNLTHIVAVGGPKVNLATEYFNEHTWAIWTSSESGTEFEELEDGGIYVFPSGNYYTGNGWSVVTVVDDLNLTSWTAIYDEECLITSNGLPDLTYNTDGNLGGTIVDGPTVVEPYAALLIWGTSGWDTRAASNWFAQYREELNTAWVNATVQPDTDWPKAGATTFILHTEHIGECCDEGYLWGIKEIIGPPAGRWRLSETAWGVWIQAPVSIRW